MRVIHVLRKPCSEPTVAANVLRHGAGAINVDATRIGTNAGWAYPNGRGDSGWHGIEGLGRNLTQPMASTAGRWPANLVLQHLPTCEHIGEKQVAGNGARVSSLGKGREGNHTNGIYGAKASKVTTAYVSEDGTETVAAWACAPGCPVAGLDEQGREMGVHSAGSSRESRREVASTGLFSFPGDGHRYGDTGGASRFFKQVKP